MQMLKTLHQIYKVNTSSSINAFLYFLKKLPILKSKLKNINYSFLKFKKAIGIVSVIYNGISAPIKSFLIFLLIYLPSIFIAEENAHLALPTLILFFYYVLRIAGTELLATDFKKFIMVKQLRMNPKNYALATVIPNEIVKFLGKAIIFTLFLNFSPFGLYGVVLAISISFFAIFSEAIHLLIYDKYNITMANHNTLLVIVYFAIYVVGYALAFISPLNIFLNILISPIFIIVTIALGIWGGIYLYRYDGYAKAINETNNVENMVKVKNAVAEAQFGSVKINEKDYENQDLNTNKFTNKEGYNYLNAIFFDRHKRIVYRPMMIKSLIIVGIFLAFIIVVEFFYKELGFLIGNGIYERFTLFVFAMYILCNSERTVKSMFHNCDITLLRYGFYKKGDALLKMFFLRLLRIIHSNLIPTTILAIGVGFSITHYTFIEFMDVIPIILLLYALALFFSVHYIFMYYIFQPFTTSMQVKNPFYSIINFMVYFISYMLIQVPAPPTIFLPMIIGLLVLYIIVAILLVYNKAPQTFRIK